MTIQNDKGRNYLLNFDQHFVRSSKVGANNNFDTCHFKASITTRFDFVMF